MRRFAVAALIPSVLLLASCGQGASRTDAAPATSSSSPTSSSSSSSSSSSAPASADATSGLLDFTASTVDGETFDGDSLKGRPTVLWFWAPWCPTCRGQIPQVEGLAADYDGEVNVIGIGSLDSAEAIAEFADGVDGVTQLEDVDGELWKRFGVAEQSSFVVLDADGAVAFEAGYGGSDDLGAEVESLLG